ncbi:hypothetical protein LS684_12415 [Cytobacillus spongiae]|uniref:hypothetical protein n=1 Tax=Cytobacillus spongiae TaxID=2901381 RepID=UPI001F33FDF8|nr:hypothetical protein [Cytobacillus spongiae]UII54476.1 hypothetical protein LS684_12415 [Cytobacillus spongiae]
MNTFQQFLVDFTEDVNAENSTTIAFFERITNLVFTVLKWGGIPYLIFLLFTLNS